jgi:hypothetical protein
MHLSGTLNRGLRSIEQDASLATEVLDLLLRIIDVLLRSRPELVTDVSLENVGKEVLKFLPEAYQHIAFSNNSNSSGSAGATICLSITSIWHSYSSSSLGTLMLLQHPDTLRMLIEILSPRRHTVLMDGDTKALVVLECLGLLKNLTYYGEDHRRSMVEHFELMSTLTSLTSNSMATSQGGHDKTMERLSAVFRNLALSSDVRLLLAQKANVLTALVRLAAGSRNNRSVNCSYGHILRNVLSAWSSLAMDGQSINIMLFHGDGMLVKQLKRFLSVSDDVVVCKRSARTIRLLARENASPAVSILHDAELLQILSQRAMCDADEGVRTECQEAFARCAGLVRAPMEQYDAVLDTLSKMTAATTFGNIIAPGPPSTQTTPINGVSAEIVTRALRDQAQHPENRMAMGARKDLVEGLANILSRQQALNVAKDNVCYTLLDLSKESYNHAVLASSPTLLAAMVTFLLERPAASLSLTTQLMRQAIVQSILNLAQSPTTWKMLAKQTSMIRCLLQFVSATTTDADLKILVKAVILQLASEL